MILNLQSSETDLSKRLIDFASGLTYALDGGMQRIADKVFMLTPRNVEISAEERARLDREGLLQSELGRALAGLRPASSLDLAMQIGLIGAATWRARSRAGGAARALRRPGRRARARRSPPRSAARRSRATPRSPSAPISSCSATSRRSCATSPREVAPHAKAVASILAATPLQALREAYPGKPVYRFIPSLPVEVRQGAVVQGATPRTPPARAPRPRRRARRGRRASCSPSSARSSCSTTRSSTSRWA